jgi:hypothetical protein
LDNAQTKGSCSRLRGSYISKCNSRYILTWKFVVVLQYLSFENTGIIGKKLYKNVHLIDLIKIYDFGTNLKSNMTA